MYPNKGVTVSASKRLDFIEVIEPSRVNAVEIQKLSLQDLKAGGFPAPHRLANPYNLQKLLKQQRRLRMYPQYYSGYVVDGQLIAFIKQKDWTESDERPFVLEAEAVKLASVSSQGFSPPTGDWGIFGLVAYNGLDDELRDLVLEGLLLTSFKDADGKSRTVNAPIHENDPLLPIAIRHGFVPVGPMGKADGAPGLLQQRYQRPATD